MLLEGLSIPLTTPFYPDGRLYLRKLEANAEHYARTLAAGLAVLTPSGEPDRLNDDERSQVLETVAGATARETVLLADISQPSVRGCLAVAETAATFGYDVALLRLPRLATGSTAVEQRTLARAVSDRSPLPVVLLEEANEPLPESLCIELAHHPQVFGWVAAASAPAAIKAVLAQTLSVRREVTVTTVFAAVTGRMLQARAGAAGSGSYISAASLTTAGGTALAVAPPEPAIKTRTKQVGFQVLAGRTDRALDALRAGATGALPPFAACSPQSCYELFAAWREDDQLLADQKFERLLDAARTLETELGIAGLKTAADLNGYFGGTPRLPGLPLLGEQRALVQQLMRGMRN